MDEQTHAKQIYDAIQKALAQPVVASPPFGPAQYGPETARYTATREGGCLSCDPGACWVCGYIFSGERIVIRHINKGERVLSDKALHLLSHGIVRYQTHYVVRGEPVVVDLDVDELAGYLR
jgi:hypothetical protein